MRSLQTAYSVWYFLLCWAIPVSSVFLSVFFHVALNVNIASYEEINLLLQDFLSNENLRSNLVNQCVMTLIHPPP